MCTEEQHRELCKLLKIAIEGRPPIDFMVEISDFQFWSVDYKERKHLFFWVGTNITLTLEDYGSLTNPTEHTWFNLALPTGLKIATSGNGTTTTPVFFRATDETVP